MHFEPAPAKHKSFSPPVSQAISQFYSPVEMSGVSLL